MGEPLVGILGGMGPAATAEFYGLLVRRTPATRDQEHLRLAFWADPTVPERVPALRGTGPSAEPALRHGVRQLQALGVDFIACPCNTAHAWLPRIVDELGVPLVSIVDATAEECRRVVGTGGTVGVLATSGTLEAGLYQAALRRRGIEALLPSPRAQERVTEAIRLVKVGTSDALALAGDLLDRACHELAETGAVAVLGGCTEIGVAASRRRLPMPVVDSLEALAAAVVARARTGAV